MLFVVVQRGVQIYTPALRPSTSYRKLVSTGKAHSSAWALCKALMLLTSYDTGMIQTGQLDSSEQSRRTRSLATGWAERSHLQRDTQHAASSGHPAQANTNLESLVASRNSSGGKAAALCSFDTSFAQFASALAAICRMREREADRPPRGAARSRPFTGA